MENSSGPNPRCSFRTEDVFQQPIKTADLKRESADGYKIATEPVKTVVGRVSDIEVANTTPQVKTKSRAAPKARTMEKFATLSIDRLNLRVLAFAAAFVCHRNNH